MSTATPEATPNSASATYAGAHLYLTLDEEDQNQVLELVRSDESGMFIRDNGSWARIDPNAENDRVWNRVIIDVSEKAVDVFDLAESSGTQITAAQFRKYELREEDIS